MLPQRAGGKRAVQKRQPFRVSQAPRGQQQAKRPYMPHADIRDPLEGMMVEDPSQLKPSTKEALRRAQKCYRCFQAWGPLGHF